MLRDSLQSLQLIEGSITTLYVHVYSLEDLYQTLQGQGSSS